MSQMTFGLLLISKHRDNDHFFVWTHLYYNNYLMPIKGWTADQIFPLCLFVVSLPLNDLSSQYCALNIKHRQLILVHFFFSVNCDDVSIESNTIPKLDKDRFKQICFPCSCVGYKPKF